MRKTFGSLLVAAPFAFVTWIMMLTGGWQEVVGVWGTVAVIGCCIFGGLYLINPE